MKGEAVRPSRPIEYLAASAGRFLFPLTTRAGQILRLLLVAMLLAADLANAETSFVLGAATHLTRQPRPIDQSLDALAAAGVMSLRDDAGWGRVERERGVLKIPAQWDEVIDGAVARGIEPLLILDYGNNFYDGGGKPTSAEGIAAFVRYSQFLAQHFKGRVKRYEVWNEWNHGPGNVSPASADAYLRLVKAVHAAVKQVDPEAEIIAGAITPVGIREGFLTRLVEQGVLDHSDAISLHPYNTRNAEDWAQWMKQVGDDLERRAGRPVRVYLTEIAWPAHQGKGGVSEKAQAENLVRMFLLAKTLPFIKGIWWYDLQNDGPDPKNREHNFGLLDHELRPKPAYLALQQFSGLIREGEYVDSLADGPALRALHLRKDGEDMLALWSTDRAACPKARLTAKRKIQALIEQRPGARQAISWNKIPGGQGQALYQSDLPLSSMPQVVTIPDSSLTDGISTIHCIRDGSSP